MMNMNNLFCDNFIRKYIIDLKKDRLIYEYNSKKRQNCIMRFCHNAEILIKKNCIKRKGKSEDIIMYLRKNDSYFIVSTKYDSGTYMNYDDLKKYLDDDLLVVIIISENFSIVREEVEYDSTAYLISSNDI